MQDGETKLAGEEEVLKVMPAGRGVVLRVPILYGECETNAESAVNILIDAIRKHSRSDPAKMDNWAQRYPTNVMDVGRVLVDLSVKLNDGQTLPQRLHFSAQECLTKFDMAQRLMVCLDFGGRVVDVPDAPKEGEVRPAASARLTAQTPRPRDCHLSVAALEAIGVDVSTAVPFSSWWYKVRPYQKAVWV